MSDSKDGMRKSPLRVAPVWAVVLAVSGVLASYFLAYMRSSAPDRAFREVAAGTDADTCRRLTRQLPPCAFAGTSHVDLSGLAVPLPIFLTVAVRVAAK